MPPDTSPPPSRPRTRHALRALFAACLAAVLTASLLPVAELPPVQTGWDKADHAIAWFGLGLLGTAAWPRERWPVLLGLVAFGGAVELLQGLTGHRQAEWADLAADAIGVAAAAIVTVMLKRSGRP